MNISFTKHEKSFIAGIGIILAVRTLGFSLITPVFSIYSTEIPGSTATLAGIAVGIFSITQTILQVPFGRLSDAWGRKETTILGFFIFLVGTLLGGLAENIYILIVSRFIAGAGAVSAVTMAWLTEGIDPGKRNSALSYVGIAIGTAVILGFTFSPLIAGRFGIPFIFYISAMLIFFLILYILCGLQNHRPQSPQPAKPELSAFRELLCNRDLMRLNFIGFIGHFCITSIFFIMPILIKREMDISEMWKIYVPVAVVGTSAMYYFSRKADSKGTVRIACIALLLAVTGVMIPVFNAGIIWYLASFVLFYSGFCILSPVLPAAVSRHPDNYLKGSILGLFNSSQFIGSGAGGIFSGCMLGVGHQYLFGTLAALLLLCWFCIIGFKDFDNSGDGNFDVMRHIWP
ncbi:MAG TPA: MFS transporter [Spirochaetota bacterium]|nr:MFS transporter [Spirochaetota bacterium]